MVHRDEEDEVKAKGDGAENVDIEQFHKNTTSSSSSNTNSTGSDGGNRIATTEKKGEHLTTKVSGGSADDAEDEVKHTSSATDSDTPIWYELYTEENSLFLFCICCVSFGFFCCISVLCYTCLFKPRKNIAVTKKANAEHARGNPLSNKGMQAATENNFSTGEQEAWRAGEMDNYFAKSPRDQPSVQVTGPLNVSGGP